MKCVFMLLVLMSSTAAAQDVPEPPAIPPGEDQIEHVVTNARAPYDGMLLSIDTAIRWTNALRWWPETFRLRVQHLEHTMELRQQSWDRQQVIVAEGHQRELELLLARVSALSAEVAVLRDPPFRKTRAFGFLSGALTFVVAAVVGLVAASI
jgi:hypothetical protein